MGGPWILLTEKLLLPTLQNQSKLNPKMPFVPVRGRFVNAMHFHSIYFEYELNTLNRD